MFGYLFRLMVIVGTVWLYLFATDVTYAAVIEVSGDIATNTTWTSGNIYLVTGDVTVNSEVNLTLEPGVIVKFESGNRLIVDGKLSAEGTSGQRISFTSYRDDTIGGDTNGDGSSNGSPGDWEWIEFHDSSDDTSIINYAVIRYGGRQPGVIHRSNVYLIDASPTIQNSTIAYSSQDGIYLEATSFGSTSPTVNSNVFDNNDDASISIDLTSFPSLSNNLSLNNGTNGMTIRGGTIGNNTIWDQTDMVYRVIGDVAVANGSTLTIAPDMIIKFNSGYKLAVDGKLSAEGTSGQKISFTSYRDDTIGGDTNGDGSSNGSPGDWEWIEFHDSSDDTSIINYAVIRYGGRQPGAIHRSNVYLIDASPTIQNSTIAYSSQDGIYL